MSTTQGESAEHTENLLIERCYCPGDEYAKFFPELNKVILDMSREYGRKSQIYRIPALPKNGIPDVNILKSISKFKDFSRDELLEVDFVDFITLENDAIEQAEVMRVYNNETLENYQTTFDDLKIEDNEFKANMTERLKLILEAQGLIQEGDQRRVRH